MRRFARFACFDWSGAAVLRPPGIALAIIDRAGPPRMIEPPGGWSRMGALDWLREAAAAGEDMLIGIDFSPALPFADSGAYFPGWSDSPADARALWALVDDLTAGDLHLSVSTLFAHPEIARYFRQHGGRQGDRFGSRGGGRLRLTEERAKALRLSPSSTFNCVGAAQVGKSSLTGMRLLHKLGGAIPIWPFDAVPETGPLLVEIYTSLAARAAGLAPGRSKLRTPAALNAALIRFEAAPLAMPRHDDHRADAALTAAWLRHVADDPALWHPADLDRVAMTEGWTFGVT
ncbi:hypothetical protein GCM10011380_26280 [Sphingomonas metalli]|uniref:DUF429 domain-containing protein n=1 Tax=Sphingomonas metalli TaxID=1779358 RepID=A0A916WUQ6_9SPHN|nr:hypothetical protein [Sphingomonas metalli]GGB35658.1 hypothetical protein GCM10011380_26280 [Sphingomonas metalli]